MIGYSFQSTLAHGVWYRICSSKVHDKGMLVCESRGMGLFYCLTRIQTQKVYLFIYFLIV